MRIIPAYAGQISEAPVRRIWRRDHPRIRGTNWYTDTAQAFIWGSPPHTRDKLRILELCFVSVGITPAYAGQMGNSPPSLHILRDHPRIRGTNERHGYTAHVQMGSPPHTRDKYQQRTLRHFRSGITPAYAGQIKKSSKSLGDMKDHPRIRGTNSSNGSK